MAVHAVLQTVSVAIILHIYRTDFRFRSAKSHLDKACDFAVASAVISYGTVIALTLTGVAAGKCPTGHGMGSMLLMSLLLQRPARHGPRASRQSKGRALKSTTGGHDQAEWWKCP